jgi:hypothetical protein
MLKLLAVIAMVFAIAQAPVPTTGKASDNSTNNRRQASQSAKYGKTPPQTASPITAQNNSSNSLKSESDNTSAYNQQGSINITNGAPVPVPWSLPKLAVWLGWLANLVLTGFLIWGVLVARKTLKAIERQGLEMKGQRRLMAGQIAEAKAQVALLAEQNRNAKHRERAKLIVWGAEPPEIFPTEAILEGRRPLKVRLLIENLGGSTAFNVRAWGVVKIVYDMEGGSYDVGFMQQFPSIVEASKTIHYLNLGGFGREFQGIAMTVDFMTITEDMAQQIHKGEAFIKVSGALVYDDIFEDTNETPFFLVWHPFGNTGSGDEWPSESYWTDRSPKPSPPKNVKDRQNPN